MWHRISFRIFNILSKSNYYFMHHKIPVRSSCNRKSRYSLQKCDYVHLVWKPGKERKGNNLRGERTLYTCVRLVFKTSRSNFNLLFIKESQLGFQLFVYNLQSILSENQLDQKLSLGRKHGYNDRAQRYLMVCKERWNWLLHLRRVFGQVLAMKHNVIDLLCRYITLYSLQRNTHLQLQVSPNLDISKFSRLLKTIC
jgi:hypothetical protein